MWGRVGKVEINYSVPSKKHQSQMHNILLFVPSLRSGVCLWRDPKEAEILGSEFNTPLRRRRIDLGLLLKCRAWGFLEIGGPIL